MATDETTTKPADAGADDPHRLQRWLLGIIAAVLILIVLVQGRVFLIPLAIAILLFALTSAAIDMLGRVRIGGFTIPNWMASIVTVLIIAALLLGLFGIVTAQINAVVATSTTYIERGEQVIALLFAWLGDDVAAAVVAAFQDIDFGSYLRAFAGSAGNLLSATLLVILYVGFLYAERPWFSRKLERLFASTERAQEVGAVLGTIAASVRHYVLVKTVISLVTAVAVYCIYLLFDLDFAEALAILAFALNFIPNIGSIVATFLPALVALVQFGDWWSAVLVLVTAGAVQFALGNIADPMMMGRTLHLSSFAVILSLTFWGAIWGTVGLFLAVPIMVMVLIVCTHVPRLRPVAILLSRDGEPTRSEPAADGAWSHGRGAS